MPRSVPWQNPVYRDRRSVASHDAEYALRDTTVTSPPLQNFRSTPHRSSDTAPERVSASSDIPDPVVFKPA
ncbi:unnamed protein product [Acanthoscelides obtectus]|uniref:Uncharacterized protein n=1 Tax=Acanthoscelides obtectus TaxID=200917 RepID=A0A9P0PEM4_ACAOB|nr:unnamed protein product [Acanthoscelides obtectus]CAK1655112.1 hypothetical protein AOBTE_LOCUS19033 [Acanthoscelides obtectus]